MYSFVLPLACVRLLPMSKIFEKYESGEWDMGRCTVGLLWRKNFFVTAFSERETPGQWGSEMNMWQLRDALRCYASHDVPWGICLNCLTVSLEVQIPMKSTHVADRAWPGCFLSTLKICKSRGNCQVRQCPEWHHQDKARYIRYDLALSWWRYPIVLR